MSKCKPVLDGNKITHIRVVTKVPQTTTLGPPATKSPDDSKPGTAVRTTPPKSAAPGP